MSGYDDDDWVGGLPPEGHHTRDQAKPAFWWRTRPARLGFAGILVALVVLVLVIVLAGCGGGDDGAASGGGEPRAQQSPQDVLRDTQAALEDLHSYHVKGTSTDKDGENRISGDITDTGSLRFTVADDSGRFTVIAKDGRTYLKAGRAFWLKGHGSSGEAMAQLFAGRWVKMPAAASTTLQQDVRQLLPKELAYCLSRGLGTLENLGARQAHGKAIVVIRDKGDKPGTSPGELTVAATGSALPLLVRQTGPRRPGGKVDARCQEDDDTTTRSESVLSRFNAVKPIEAPAGALDLDALGRGGGGTPA
jgi:hypothetical protein